MVVIWSRGLLFKGTVWYYRSKSGDIIPTHTTPYHIISNHTRAFKNIVVDQNKRKQIHSCITISIFRTKIFWYLATCTIKQSPSSDKLATLGHTTPHNGLIKNKFYCTNIPADKLESPDANQVNIIDARHSDASKQSTALVSLPLQFRRRRLAPCFIAIEEEAAEGSAQGASRAGVLLLNLRLCCCIFRCCS